MIFLELNGRWPQSKRFEKFGQTIIEELIPEELDRDFLITCTMRQHLLHDDYDNHRRQDSGLCWLEEEDHVEIELARNFICVDPKKYKDHKITKRGKYWYVHYMMSEIAESLIHELTHGKQYILGELSDTDKNLLVDGYPIWWWEKHFRHSELPWEQEAYLMEHTLIDLW